LRRSALFCASLCALAVPSGAWAHASLVRSVPADGGVLGTAPASVRLFFDDDVRAGSGIKAIRNVGGSVLARKPYVQNGRVLVVPLQAHLGDGDYTVLWRVESDDGHHLAGVTAFGVGVNRPPPAAALTVGGGGPSAQDVIARVLFFAGLLTAGGAAFFRFAVGRVPVRLLLFSFLLVFVGASGMLHDTSLSTRFGAAMAVTAIVAAIGATVATIASVYALLEPAAFALAFVLLPMPSLAGHALDSGRSRLEFFSDVIHVAAASIWLGGLVALALALRSADAERAETVRRFSNIALASVIALAVTGVYRAFAELDAVSQLWTTGYGRVLVVKTALLSALVVLGWLNRYRLIPRLSFSGLRRNVRGELVLFVGLVAAVALLTDLRPGRDRLAQAATTSGPAPLPAKNMVVQAQEAGDRVVALATRPPGAELTVLNADGEGVNGLDVTLGGMQTRSCGNGCYGAFGHFAGTVAVTLDNKTVRFSVPARPRAAAPLVRRATRAFRALRSVSYVERLASSPRDRVVADFTLERPNRLEYHIRGGADGIVIGNRRWDRAEGGKWIPSEQSPTPQPEPVWAGPLRNAYLFQTTDQDYVVSFLNPNGPAWFLVYLDRRTLRPRMLGMTAPAHFMVHTYTSFNVPPRIRAPAVAQ
jgi:copper transport protein